MSERPRNISWRPLHAQFEISSLTYASVGLETET